MVQVKKEFKELIRPLEGKELEQLEKSIKEEGVRDKIITWN